MRYDVTYQIAGDERTERVEAPDAAAAAAAIHDAHGRSADLFELISVQLLDEPSYPLHTYANDESGGAPGGRR